MISDVGKEENRAVAIAMSLCNADVDTLGHGSTSIVYRCRNRQTGQLHACKVIDRRSIQSKRNELMEQIQVRFADVKQSSTYKHDD